MNEPHLGGRIEQKVNIWLLQPPGGQETLDGDEVRRIIKGENKGF